MDCAFSSSLYHMRESLLIPNLSFREHSSGSLLLPRGSPQQCMSLNHAVKSISLMPSVGLALARNKILCCQGQLDRLFLIFDIYISSLI